MIFYRNGSFIVSISWKTAIYATNQWDFLTLRPQRKMITLKHFGSQRRFTKQSTRYQPLLNEVPLRSEIKVIY